MNEKEIIKNENINLENLLSNIPDLNILDSPLPSPSPSTFKITNFENVIIECKDQALIIVQNAALFYISQLDIDNNPYVKNKIEMDVMELSNLIFQSKSAQTSYVKLLEEIDGGNVHPRIFEVQSALQKSMMEITKSKTTYIQIMENSWKEIKNELQISGKSAIIESEESESGTRVKGTKDIIRNIQSEIRESNPEKLF